MIVRVIIRDGIIESVLADDEAKRAGVQVEIVDFDRNTGNEELLDKYYSDEINKNIDYFIEHCEPDEEENPYESM